MLGFGAMEHLCCHHVGDLGCPAGETTRVETEVPQPTTSHVNKAILDHPAPVKLPDDHNPGKSSRTGQLGPAQMADS